MSEGGFDIDLVLSLITTVIGGALSAYLAKKMIDALDTGKKVIVVALLFISQDADAAKKTYADWQRKFEARTGKTLEIENNVRFVVID